jgi:hemoglobin/transferrin/lactoferrin receptor protein
MMRWCLFGALISVVGTSVGIGAEPMVDLTDVVVVAARDERAALELPYSTSTLSSDELRLERAVRTIPEALEYEPGVMVQKTGHGQGSPYIRGFTGYRNLLLIDGVRLNNSVFRDGPNQYWNTVDPYGLSRLELVRGPSSVLYGSDAIGGVVNAITRGAEDLQATPWSEQWNRRLYYRYASAEDSHIGRAEVIGKATDNLLVGAGITAKRFGDLEGGSEVGTQSHTGYDELDWDAKLQYIFSDDAYAVLAHQSVAVDDAWRTHKTIYGIDWKGLTIGSETRRTLDQERDLTYLQFHHFDLANGVDELHIGISHHLQSEERDRLRSRSRHDVQGFDVETLGVQATLKSFSPIGTLIYGADFYHDDVSSYAYKLDEEGQVTSRSIQGPVADDATYDTLGLYVQDEIAISEQLVLTLGLRYEYAEADARTVEDPVNGGVMPVAGDWDNVAGSLRALYWLDDAHRCNLFGGLSQGFRAPNLSDLTRYDSARTDEIETPAPDLDPEEFLTGEIGIKAGTRTVDAQLAYFYTSIDGMIVRTPTGRQIDGDYEVTKRNAGDGYIHGVELDAGYRFLEAYRFFITFTWIDGEVDTYPTSADVMVTEPIDRLMPPTGRTGLRWSRHDLWLEGSLVAAAKADKLSTRDAGDTSRIPPGGTPGYVVVDLRAGWQAAPGLSLSLAIENLTDEDYRVHGSGLNEPGRNLVLACDWLF